MKKLKLKRIDQDISQWDLSQTTGIPNYRISLIENGRVRPKAEELEALAKALGTTAEAITATDFINKKEPAMQTKETTECQ